MHCGNIVLRKWAAKEVKMEEKIITSTLKHNILSSSSYRCGRTAWHLVPLSSLAIYILRQHIQRAVKITKRRLYAQSDAIDAHKISFRALLGSNQNKLKSLSAIVQLHNLFQEAASSAKAPSAVSSPYKCTSATITGQTVRRAPSFKHAIWALVQSGLHWGGGRNKSFAEPVLFNYVSLRAVLAWDSVDSGVLSAVMGCVSVLLRAALGWV